MKWLGRVNRPSPVEILIFFTVFLSASFFSEIAYQTSKYTARLFLTQAMVDQQTFRLDAYEDELGVDGAAYDGHLYSNKPLGSSLLMLPQYLLVGKPFKALYNAADIDLSVQNQEYQVDEVFSGWLVQTLSLALYTAISFVALYRIFDLLGIKRRRLPLVLLSYFGTLMFAYATIGNGEMYTVPLLILGTYHLLKVTSRTGRQHSTPSSTRLPESRSRLTGFLWAGIWFGLAFLTTNQVALMIVIAFIAVIWQEKNWKAPALFAAPIIVSGLVTLAYNWINFDSPFSFPIQFWIQGTPEVILFEFPTLTKLAEMLFLPWKGLFFYSPFLIFSLPGFRLLYRQSRTGDNNAPTTMPMVFYLAGAPLVFFIFLLFNVGWFGGADYGFRYAIPILPYLSIGAAVWLNKRKLTVPIWILIIWSVVICSIGALTDPEVPTMIRNPILAYNLPMFASVGTNNVINLIFEQLFGINVWLFRIATTAAFFGALSWFTWRYRGMWRDL